MNSVSELSENVVQECNTADLIPSCQPWNNTFSLKHRASTGISVSHTHTFAS